MKPELRCLSESNPGIAQGIGAAVAKALAVRAHRRRRENGRARGRTRRHRLPGQCRRPVAAERSRDELCRASRSTPRRLPHPRGGAARSTVGSNAASTPRAWAWPPPPVHPLLGLELAEYGIRCNLVSPIDRHRNAASLLAATGTVALNRSSGDLENTASRALAAA